MAWLKWRGTEKRGKYHAMWTENVAGRARKRSRALHRDRRAAEVMLHRIERNLALKGVGMGQVVTVEQLRADYLQLLAANGCAKTYLERVRIILGHLERLFPRLKVPALTVHVLDAYKFKRLTENVGATTINREVGVIKAAVRKGRRWQYQIQDLADVTKVRAAEKVRGDFGPAEIRALLAGTDPLMRLVVRLGLYAGLRRMEMVNLTWANVDFEQGSLTLGDGWKTKSGKTRAVPLHPELANILKGIYLTMVDAGRAPATDDTVLGWKKSLQSLSGRFTYFLRKKCQIGHGSLHGLRHTFLTALKRENADTGKVMRIAGHANEKTTQGYVHLDVGDLRAEVNRVKYE